METLQYIGREQPDTRLHDGGLRPVMGAWHRQVMRANREHPQWSQGTGFTYNHAPMLCRWRGAFYLMYLSSPVHEHDGFANALLMRSTDGFSWSQPQVIFPSIPVPPGVYAGKKADQLPRDARTVVHHRMGFYIAPNGVLLVMTHHGVTPDVHVIPNSGYGMGRVVRRVRPDGTLDGIFVLRVNRQAGWKKEHFPYPWFEESSDADFVAACRALWKDPLANGAWWEEERLDTSFFPLQGIRAPSFCHLPDGRVAAIGKSGLCAVSADEGMTWSPVQKAPGVISAGGKCWMTRTGDGGYAIVYNPSPDGQHRWPLAIITSRDGVCYDHMYCAGGEVAPMRYGGLLKDFGLNYIRGMMEGNDDAPDGCAWLAYSMNKEDIWTLRLPPVIEAEERGDVRDCFASMDSALLERWYLYSPLWAEVSLRDGCLELHDSDPWDAAKAVRPFRPGKCKRMTVCLSAHHPENGLLQLDVTDARGMVAARVELERDGQVYVRGGNGRWPVGAYAAERMLELSLCLDAGDQSFILRIDGMDCPRQPFMCPVPAPERMVLRTGKPWMTPTPEDNLKDVCLPDLPDAGERLPEVCYRIASVTILDEAGEPA